MSKSETSAKPEHYDVIVKPIITEKATLTGETSNAVVFQVAKSATKPMIRNAVEALFGVKVKAVNTTSPRARPSVSAAAPASARTSRRPM